MGNLGRIAKMATLGFTQAALAVAVALSSAAREAVAAPPSPRPATYSAIGEGDTSNAARRDALRSIPLEKLKPEDERRVRDILGNVTVFRRLPTKKIDCDPEMYLFLVRHPDVVVNIWELFKISKIQLRETSEGRFRVIEPAGTVATVRFLYESRDTHVIYGEGVYEGSLLSRPVKGRGILVLKTSYARGTNGRSTVTSRMDCFVSVLPAGADLITKTISPWVGKTVDNNFVLTLSFVGSLSRTAELNSRGVSRLAAQLSHVQPDVRTQFSDLTTKLSPPSAPATPDSDEPPPELAARPDETVRR